MRKGRKLSEKKKKIEMEARTTIKSQKANSRPKIS